MYLWHKKCLLAFLTLSTLLAVCSCAGKQISTEGSTEDNQTGYDESYPEYDAPTEPILTPFMPILKELSTQIFILITF